MSPETLSHNIFGGETYTSHSHTQKREMSYRHSPSNSLSLLLGVTLSGSEAEYVAISKAVKEIKLVYYLLQDSN